ncbi:hypothetical protein J7E97_30855 [Streptomyces sp. ISL-66]|uniref:hypothetical protein n=1 Tax=Streptomyces sp. ISL-66 TaxID=2819186 RepID=UPI001BEC5585|nr:hypothetical protein [Streptomyces sp. ISL-66]MBT2472141.1 hypothetical protein [Streptomyces sp. ISL-66]
MISFTSARSKNVVAAAAGAVVAGACTMAATPADAGPARSPYAQAAALVVSNGTLLQAKGIAGVSKPSAGVYCITFTDSRVEAQEITPVATIATGPDTPWGTVVHLATDPTESCGRADNTVTAFTGSAEGLRDNAFYITVP